MPPTRREQARAPFPRCCEFGREAVVRCRAPPLVFLVSVVSSYPGSRPSQPKVKCCGLASRRHPYFT